MKEKIKINIKQKRKIIYFTLGVFIIFATFFPISETSANAIISRSLYIGLNKSLLAYFPFDARDVDTTTNPGSIIDRSGNGNDIASDIVGDYVVPGKIGQGLFIPKFIGTEPLLFVVPEPNDLDNITSMTMAAWVWQASTTSGNRAYVLNYFEGGGNGWGISLDNGDTLVIRDDVNNADTDRYLTDWSSNQWHHVVAVFTTDNINKLYLDGQLVGDGDVSSANISSYTGVFAVGGRGGGSSPTENSIIDEVRVYERALLPGEIKRLYNIGKTARVGFGSGTTKVSSTREYRLNEGLLIYFPFDAPDIDTTTNPGSIKDRSGNGNDIESDVVGDFTAPGKRGQGLKIPYILGPNLFVVPEPNDLDNITSMTMAAWVWQASTTDAQHAYVLNYFEGGGNGWGIRMEDGEFLAIEDDIDNAGFERYISDWSSNQWHHVAITFATNNENRLYLDGELIGYGDTSSSNISAFTGVFSVGGRGGGSSPLPYSIIDEVRVYGRELTAAEIKQLYNIDR